MQCSQCEKTAIGAFGPAQVPLCVKCYDTLVKATREQNRALERMMNFLYEEMGGITGFPRSAPFPTEPIVNYTGDVNQITVSNSTVGAINTGSVNALNVAISHIEKPEVSDALRELGQAVIDNPDLSEEQKKAAVDILSVISGEAVASPEGRREAAIRPLITELSAILSGVHSLKLLGEQYIPVLIDFFFKAGG